MSDDNMEDRKETIQHLVEEINELNNLNNELKYINDELKNMNQKLEEKNQLLNETISDIINYYSGNGFVPKEVVSHILKAYGNI